MEEKNPNFLPKQYEETNKLPINHNYLSEQFSDSDEVIEDIRKLIKKGDFTLGQAVDHFEEEFTKITKAEFALGVGSGTDALFLSLKSLGVKE